MEELTERERGVRNIVFGLVISIPSSLFLNELGWDGPAKGIAVLVLACSYGCYKFLRGIIGYISNG